MEVATITPKQAADRFGVSPVTIHNWIEKGTLKAWRTPGGHRRITMKSVDALFRLRERELCGDPEEPVFSVLVVEEDPLLLKSYEMRFRSSRLPLEILTAASGVEGLVQAVRTTPDCLIADLTLSDVNGFAMMRKLKSDLELHGILAIAVTNLDQREVQQHGGLPDDVEYFQKPVPFARLVGRIRDEILRKRQSNGRARALFP